MDPTSAAIIDRLLTGLNERMPRYKLWRDYIRGQHPLVYASDTWRSAFAQQLKTMVDNLTPTIVEANVSGMQLRGFKARPSDERHADPADAVRADQYWRRSRLDQAVTSAIREAWSIGDAYLIVDTVVAGGRVRPVTHFTRGDQCSVEYSTEHPGRALHAIKVWETTDGAYRINLYRDQHGTEKYITAPDAASSGLAQVSSESLTPFLVDGEPWPLPPPDPEGRIPVWHLAATSELGEYGTSAIADAVPLQNALNKSVCDLLVAGEYSSFKQRWASGVEIELDDDGNPINPWQIGHEKILTAISEHAKFGEFSETDLSKLIEMTDSFRIEMARVTRTPIDYMQLSSSAPSGTAIRLTREAHHAKLREAGTAWGGVIEDMLEQAGRIGGESMAVDVEWVDPSAPSEAEQLEMAETARRIGLPLSEVLVRWLGYDEDQAKLVLAEADAEASRAAERAAAAFDAGQII